ncbi:response regulator [Microbacterium sp. LRZ72]|uniref:response regulator n=1 Tax=Microbacterium sp. LRZ72 TaxID=2942481 RepID=UPI0029BE3BA8|nr:response regulator [Microbacterium sp. LRZ72]MDX2377144.1 response regulator [Microbacterium sp. LRZ72]
MAIARLSGGPLDGQVVPLEDPSQDSLILAYTEGQVVYDRQGEPQHTGEHDGPTEVRFVFVESTQEIGQSDE